MEKVYLSLGSNIEDRYNYLSLATNLISLKVGSIIKSSKIYETQPWGFDDNTNFLNSVVLLDTQYLPNKLLYITKQIEKELGRIINKEKGYSSRQIDIDILFYNNIILNNDNLTIPHPLIAERKFVLMPLNEIADTLVHPVHNKTINQLLFECKDKSCCKIYNK